MAYSTELSVAWHKKFMPSYAGYFPMPTSTKGLLSESVYTIKDIIYQNMYGK